MIDKSDISALRMMSDLQKMPGIEPCAEIMSATIKALESYDFDLAQQEIDRLDLDI